MKHTILALLLVAALGLAVAPAAAQDTPPDYPTNTITVVGTGSALGTPDIANIEIGVEVTDPDVNVAFNSANETIDAVINAVTEVGVAREDIRTTGFNIFRERFGGPVPMQEGAEQPEPTYIVNNQLRITVRDITSVAQVINAAVNAGANNIYGLSFNIDDRAALERDARAEAMADARDRAEQLAELIGAELGDVLIVNEQTGGGFAPFPVMEAAAGLGGGGAQIEPGQLTVSLQLQVTFRINR